jgi:hypothetical protein
MNDYNKLHHPLVIQLDAKSAGGTPETIEGPHVPTGRVWQVTSVAIQDVTTGFTNVKAYILGGGQKFYLFQLTTPTAGQVYQQTGPFYIPEGHQICFDLTGTTAADQLKVYLNGFELATDWYEADKKTDQAKA